MFIEPTKCDWDMNLHLIKKKKKTENFASSFQNTTAHHWYLAVLKVLYVVFELY